MQPYALVTELVEPRRLLGSALQAAIDRAIASVPPDKRGTVQLRITLEGVEIEAALRLFAGADAAAFWQRTPSGGHVLGGQLRWSF